MDVDKIVAGALYDIMGRLTTSKEPLIFSENHQAYPAVEFLTEFAHDRGLNMEGADVEGWQRWLGRSVAPGVNDQPSLMEKPND